MTYIVRWQSTHDEVILVTSSEDVERALSGKKGTEPAPAGTRVFLSVGSSCIELASDTTLHQRVALAVALQQQDAASR